jgi:hypothetical protein
MLSSTYLALTQEEVRLKFQRRKRGKAILTKKLYVQWHGSNMAPMSLYELIARIATKSNDLLQNLK